MNQERIMLSKLAPPRPKASILRRPALARKVRRMLLNSFSLIVAGAGYGKSTSVATFLADERIAACWYRITETERELPVFLQHIIASIRLTHQHVGQAFLETVDAAEQQGLRAAHIEELAFQFIQEITRIRDDILLVLDNYDQVETSPLIDQWVQQVIPNLPPNMRLVLISRNQPSWPWLSVMRIRGEYVEVGEADLRFSAEEIRELFGYDYSYALSDEELELLQQYTRGWIVAVRLLAEKVMGGDSVAELIKEGGEVSQSLLHFLNDDVFARQEPDVQHFLIVSAIFAELTMENCQYLSGGSLNLLNEVRRRHLFVHTDQAGVSRYHPMMRQLLLQKLAEDREVFHNVQFMAAHYFVGRLEPLKAIEHLEQIDEWDQIGELLVQYGESMIRLGQLEALYHWLSITPLEIKAKYPMIWFYQAEVERFRCHYQQALASYTRFSRLCEEANDVVGQCMALEGQARIHLDTVQGLQAEELLKRAIGMLDSSYHELAAGLYRLLAETYTNRGNTTEAASWYQRSKELERQTEVEVEARLLFRTGRLQTARNLLEKKWFVERKDGIFHLTRAYRETSLMLAFVYALIGEREKGVVFADKAIALGKTANSPYVEAYGYIRKGHSALLDKDFPLDEVRRLYLSALHILEELQSNRGKAESLLGLALLYGREKSLETALAYAERGLRETETVKDEWVNGLIRLSIGIAYAQSELYQQAEPVFRECVDQFSQCGDNYNVAISYLWLSYLAYKQENWESFVPTVSFALTAIKAGEYDHLLFRPTMFTPSDVQKLMPILIEAQKRQIHPDYVSQLLVDFGLQNVSFHPGYSLRIQTLGQFRVWLDDRELSEKAWQRGKAKQLFQLLLTKRQHLLAREEIVTQLWEESDEETAQRDFKVALNALNKALEPNREARASAFFIQRHGSSYGFNLASGYHIDAEEFERLVSAGLAETDLDQAMILLEKGLAYYFGEYLPECRYEDWCIAERERLHVLYLRGAEKLAQSYVTMEQYDASIRWCEKILQADDCWEEAYRLLMYCYYRKNNRALSMKWYEKCVAKLQSQFGVQPLPSTRDTFHLIMDSGQK